jgi:transposase
MGRPVKEIAASAEDVAELLLRSRAATSAHRDRFRAQITLLRLEGVRCTDVAARLGTTMPTVLKWTNRFEQSGLAGLEDKAGRGRKPSIPAAKVARVITEVTQPPKGRSRWSVRSMGRHAGISHSTVQRIWKKNDLKPHIVKTFKLSNDPKFEEKFWDVIGLYLDPPAKALVLCCDEKSQCQALERTQLSLPLAPNRRRTMTHDYKRHGTVTLFAALNALEGKLIARTEKRHTHVEWIRFLKQIDRETPKSLDIHLIQDNYATHKHKKVKAWLKRHPRFKTHFTPTSSSWMNLVERFFADLTADVIRTGSFSSVGELVRDIETYLEDRNANPRPYTWKAEGAAILEKIKRARAALDKARAARVIARQLRVRTLGIEALNLRPAQNDIRRRYGPRYHVSEECLREIAALWGIELAGERINDAGVFTLYRDIERRAGRCKAKLRLACSPSGLWAMDTSYMAALSGGGASPSVWNSLAFLSEADAKAAGLHALIGKFGTIAAEGGSDTADARKLIELLEDERTPQLSLF